MDTINIVSSQAVLEMSSFSMDTRSKSSSPLVSSLVNNRLFKTAPECLECLGSNSANLGPKVVLALHSQSLIKLYTKYEVASFDVFRKKIRG